MIDLDHVTIAVVVAASCHRNHAAICCVDRRALPSSNIDAEMTGPVVVAGEAVSIGGPGKASAAHCTAPTGTLIGGGCPRCTGCHSWHQPLHELTFASRHHHPGA